MMEDILSRDIFDAKILNKLSPDYIPSNTLVRVQKRSLLVKDSHVLKGVAKNGNNLHKKSSKRVKDSYKMNTEIAKIRSGFNKINLKNKIMLQQAVNCIESSKAKDLAPLNNADYQALVDETEPFVQNISRKTTHLALSNDTRFKINDKYKVAKVKTEQPKNEPIKQRPLEKEIQEIGCNDVLSIKCTFLSNADVALNENLKLAENQFKSLLDIKEANGHNTDMDVSNNDDAFNMKIDNLQNLLTMMAISQTAKGSYQTSAGVCSVASARDDSAEDDQNVSLDDVQKCLNIIPFRVEINSREHYISKKYADRWKVYVNYKKDLAHKQRQEILSHFFDKLAKKKVDEEQKHELNNKAKLCAKDFGTYQHRYKIQKHIIALQKAKLETQNRVIEELKYNKIVEASKQSVESLREQVRKTIYEVDRKLKPKIKCMTNELKINNIEEDALVLHCLKVPQFLQRMEKRARERDEKHALIRERRQQMEEERLRLKQQAEIAKIEMDKEEKMRRLKELKDKRKRERIESIRRKQHADRMRSLIVMADLHYERSLVAKYGIRPFKILIEMKRDNIEKARIHYRFQLKKNVFLHWMWHTEDMWFERNYKADDFHKKKLMKKYLSGFKQNAREYVLKKQVAEDYYDYYVIRFVFRKFRDGFKILKTENELKWQRAVHYHKSNVLFKSFACWRTLPALSALRRELDARKARWRDKVLLVVPDYTPPDD